MLLRELRARGYRGSYTILVEYVRPRRRGRQPEATMRFETAPGEQAQVEWNPRMLDEDRAHLGKLPERATLAPYLRGGLTYSGTGAGGRGCR